MTAAEYSKLYSEARDKWPRLTAQGMKASKQAYANAGRKIADIIRAGSMEGGNLSPETQRQVDQSILESSPDIASAMRAAIPGLVADGAALFVAIEAGCLSEAMAGVTSKVTAEGIKKLFEKTAAQAVQASINAVGADGYSLWGRIPNVSKEFGDDVVNLVLAAIDQGRDLGKIAADINKYVRDGKAGTISRWGEKIEPDSARLLRRVPERVDYRALRLARTELGRGIEATNLANGLSNPGAYDLFDWVRVNTIDWHCVCPDNQANGPYPAAEYPTNRHSNCFCYPRVRLKDGNQFRADLKAWANGGTDDGLDSWYRNKYLPAQS